MTAGAHSSNGSGEEPVTVTDLRRIDPETGEVRDEPAAGPGPARRRLLQRPAGRDRAERGELVGLERGTAHEAAVHVGLADDLGGLDRVIVNAGLGKGAPMGTGKAAANIETIQTNLVGAVAQIEAALEIFRAQNYGHLVLVSSISGIRGLPKAQTAYSASKAGVTAIGQGLQAELVNSPITVSVVAPGYIETDINRGVKTALMADTESGVAAMVKAIEAENGYSPVPAWPWTPIAAALKYLPGFVTRRMI